MGSARRAKGRLPTADRTPKPACLQRAGAASSHLYFFYFFCGVAPVAGGLALAPPVAAPPDALGVPAAPEGPEPAGAFPAGAWPGAAGAA